MGRQLRRQLRRGVGRRQHRLAGGAQYPPGTGPGHVAPAHGGHRFQELHAAARADHPGLHLDVADRDSAEDLAGEPAHDHVVTRAAMLDRPAHERARRPAVLESLIPRARGVHGRPPGAVPHGNVEAIGHLPDVTRQSPTLAAQPRRAALPARCGTRPTSPLPHPPLPACARTAPPGPRPDPALPACPSCTRPSRPRPLLHPPLLARARTAPPGPCPDPALPACPFRPPPPPPRGAWSGNLNPTWRHNLQSHWPLRHHPPPPSQASVLIICEPHVADIDRDHSRRAPESGKSPAIAHVVRGMCPGP